MKMEITGKRFGTFTNEHGTTVSFRTLYVKSPIRAVKGVVSEGYITNKIGVTRCFTDDEMRMLSVGDTIDVTFNQYGSVEGVELC